MLIKDLVEFGLSEKESSIYLALLKLEVAGVNEIAKSTKINRSTAYVTLESLKEKGLVSISDDKKVRRYVATSPEVLLRTAQNLAEKQETIKKRMEVIVPELRALHKDTKQKPIVRVFEGKQGLISAFEDTLESKEKLMRVSSSVGALLGIMPEYFPEYVKRRVQLGIKMHGIHPNDEFAQKLIEIGPKNFDKPVLVPKEKYPFPADLAIYDNKIGYMSPEKGGIAIIIESKEISDVMKSIFDLAWEEAKRLNKKSL